MLTCDVTRVIYLSNMQCGRVKIFQRPISNPGGRGGGGGIYPCMLLFTSNKFLFTTTHIHLAPKSMCWTVVVVCILEEYVFLARQTVQLVINDGLLIFGKALCSFGS